MQKLQREDLYSLEQYAEERGQFREKVMRHKRDRRIVLGANATLYFEDRLTMQYQVQEMLRIERIFEAAGIRDELDTYNALIPDGSNLKATFMIEFPEAAERRAMLARLAGIEDRVWLQVGDGEKIRAIADEDLERADDSKTSAVHFLRFELDDAAVAELKGGGKLSAGIDHDNYQVKVRPVPRNVRDALAGDLD